MHLIKVISRCYFFLYEKWDNAREKFQEVEIIKNKLKKRRKWEMKGNKNKIEISHQKRDDVKK